MTNFCHTLFKNAKSKNFNYLKFIFEAFCKDTSKKVRATKIKNEIIRLNRIVKNTKTKGEHIT